MGVIVTGMTEERKLSSIVVGERYRHDMGNITELAASIGNLGLIHPVVILPGGQLVAGARRLRAMEQLGWDVVPVTVIHSLEDATSALEAQRDENTCRKDFTPTEAAAILTAIAETLRPLAEQRKAEAGKAYGRGHPKAGDKLSPAKTRDVAAKGTGYSGATLEKVNKAKAIAANGGYSERVRAKAREVLDKMDTPIASGGYNVDGPYRELVAAEQVAKDIEEFPDLTYYADAGRDSDVLRLATALRGYAEPELSVRIAALRATIDADRNHTPAVEDIDYVALGHRIFSAANTATQTITKHGGFQTISQAVTHADPLTLTTWREQFDDLAAICAELAQLCTPQLKVVSNGKTH